MYLDSKFYTLLGNQNLQGFSSPMRFFMLLYTNSSLELHQYGDSLV